MPPLPGVDHPKGGGEHDGGRQYDETHEDPFAVEVQAGAVVAGQGREGFADEGAVGQLRQEGSVVVQSVAHVGRRRHLVVDAGSDPTHGGAHVAPADASSLADVAFPYL